MALSPLVAQSAPTSTPTPREGEEEESRQRTILVLPLLSPSRTRSTAAIDSATNGLVRSIVGPSSSSTATTTVEDDQAQQPEREDDDNSNDDDDGASSFEYTAPAPSSSAAAAAAAALDGRGGGTKTPWHISNRYYDADVVLHSVAAAEMVEVLRPPTARAAAGRRQREAAERKGQDVFAALQAVESVDSSAVVVGASSSSTSPAEMPSSSSAAQNLARKLQGVPAVLLFVDSSSSLVEHRNNLAALSRLPLREEVSSMTTDVERYHNDNDNDEEEEEEDGLSGFNLEVSLVVGLPSPQPLDIDGEGGGSTSVIRGSAATREELVDLYLAAGWEYIDLAATAGEGGEEVDFDEFLDFDQDGKQVGEDGEGIAHGGDDDDDEEEEEDGEEEDAIGRIREALMSYPWPGHVRHGEGAEQRRRHSDNAGNTSGADDVSALLHGDSDAFFGTGFSEWRQPTGVEGGEADGGEDNTRRPVEEAERTIDWEKVGDEELLDALSRLSMSGVGNSVATAAAAAAAPPPPSSSLPFPLGLQDHATPNETDEALARAFLARLENGGGITAPTSDEGGEATTPFPFPFDPTPRAMEELETFLASQDPEWPSEPLALDVTEDGRWSSRVMDPAAASTLHGEVRGEEGFDDDFSEFVSAPLPDPSTSKGASASRASTSPPHPSTTKHVDDFATSSPFPPAPPSLTSIEELDQHLHTLHLQAQRVRAIPDYEQRRREAARVALAFLGEGE